MTLAGLTVVAGLLSLSPVAVATPPPNDNIANATAITGLPAEVTGSSVDATREPDEPTSGEYSIWYTWTAPASGGVAVRTSGCSPPFQDTVESWPNPNVAVLVKSPVFGLVPVQALRGDANTDFRADAGRTYWIAISWSANQSADPDVCVRLLPAPTNDEFAAARPLTGFPVSATYEMSSELARPTTEPGEPDHGGFVGQQPPSDPLPASVWYGWTAPADGPVVVRLCGVPGYYPASAFAVYTGDRVDALTWVITRRTRETSCGGRPGARATLSAVAGELYRIAVTGPNRFELLIGTQVALVAGRFLYTAFPGQTDDLKLRLTGAGSERALLVEADGVGAASGCDSHASASQLRCPIPRRGLDAELGDGNDTADVRLPPTPGLGSIEVSGGDGDDTLVGRRSAGRSLDGGRGDDRIAGGSGPDRITGGPGADRIDPGAGEDIVDGGGGADQIHAADRASENVYCGSGRDHVRIDGVDLPRGCEHRRLSSPARAVPTSVVLSNDDGDDDDHLELSIACPVDVRGGCATRVVVAVGSHRTITRHVRLRAGRSGMVETYAFPNRVLSRGVRVTAITRRRHGGALKFTRRLGVSDVRYCGEGGECGAP